MVINGGIVASAGKQPDQPTSPSASAGNGSATVSFTASVYKGKNNSITSYIATSSPSGITGSNTSSPITVSGLSNGTTYTFTIVARVAYGSVNVDSVASSATNSVVPVAPTTTTTTTTTTTAAPTTTTTTTAAQRRRCTSQQVSLGCCSGTAACQLQGASTICTTPAGFWYC